MSAHVIAARGLRQLSLGDTAGLVRSHALLAELAMLVRAHYLRHVDDVLDEDGKVIVPAGTTQRIGQQEIRAWWLMHRHELVDMHRPLAEAHLAGIGVAA